MYKKIIGICTVLAALAAPAVAAASPVLLETPSTPLAVGAKITATEDTTSPWMLITDNAGEVILPCVQNWFSAQVAKNTGTAFELTIESAKFEGVTPNTSCLSRISGNTTVTIPDLTNEGGTGHWCMMSTTGDNWELKPEGCNGEKKPGKFTFKLDNNLGTTICVFERTNPISGTFTTGAGSNSSATLAVTGEPVLNGSGMLCPTTAKIKEMKFSLYTETSGVFIG
jgi:hypothetical protein